MSEIITPARQRVLTRPPMRRQSQPLWTPLERQQQGFFLPSCSCCGLTASACTICTGKGQPTPAQWTMTVSGVTNGSCSNCSLWNGDWTLTQDPLLFGAGSACAWSTPTESLGAAPCIGGCNNCSRWRLTLTSSAALIADGGLAAYDLDLSSFDCTGTNVLSLVDYNAECNWPATITIEPV